MRQQLTHIGRDELSALLGVDVSVLPPKISAFEITAQPGDILINHGERCGYFLLVIEGEVKVERISPQGDEISLYHLSAGQSCELATICMLADNSYPAIAIAEKKSRVLLIPKPEFVLIFQSSAKLQRHVFRDFDIVASHLLVLLEEVAFMPIDQRLAKYLMQHHILNAPIKTTHESIAHDLGTAREVVSRALRRFQHEKWIRRSRGAIWVDNIEAINHIATHHHS